MKKSLILLSVCSAALLSSCGTSSYYAYSTFDDGIYYRATKESREELLADSREVRDLIDRTRQEAARFSDTIIIAGTALEGTTGITSTATAAATPVNINLNLIDNWYDYNLLGYGTYCSYWDWRYWDVFGPWGRYYGWHDWYNWYSPWFPGIYDPWYPSWGWTWSFAWNSWGWYGTWWGGPWGGPWGWYDPWYYPWGHQMAMSRPVYYGKRSTGIRNGLTGGSSVAAGTISRGTGVDRKASGTGDRPAISVVRGRTAKASGIASATTTKRVNGTVSAGRHTAVGNFQASGQMNLGERYVSRGVAASVTGGRTVSGTGQVRRPSANYRKAVTAGTAEFRNPFESRGTSAVSGSFNSGFRSRGSAVSSGRSAGFTDRTAATAVGRGTAVRQAGSSQTRSISQGSRSVSTRSSFSSGGRSYSGGSSVRSGGGSVRR